MAHFRQKIRRAAEGRGILALYHFTRRENLLSILSNGLLSREDLADTNLQYTYTDDARWDDTPRAISFSIDSINSSMFDAKRKVDHRGWIILRVEREVLWTHSCRFCRQNASTSAVRNARGFLGGPWGFNSMFEDEDVYIPEERGYRSRRDHYQIPDNRPTWNDAEVQVLDPVDQKLITAIFVGNESMKAWAEDLAQQLGLDCEVIVDDYLAP
ncbi:DarT ssDNA thymidine ADP-ribosyltransferase family protein [Amaricoccus sp.]|uniref:DarT ssDNA thymidine ADP-ribosyltransferase family protein n=1 Tax=Amaricoccus sp. TaxID=1872485 RepID=UPI001B4FBBB0|nr:DarT ssDNA thymidine ADP-ribosyltransferase family protein [Amaricoccus sp.]MBP7001309.1 DUF4433 domain-containing protein [Amaricoccus sp.]